MMQTANCAPVEVVCFDAEVELVAHGLAKDADGGGGAQPGEDHVEHGGAKAHHLDIKLRERRERERKEERVSNVTCDHVVV